MAFGLPPLLRQLLRWAAATWRRCHRMVQRRQDKAPEGPAELTNDGLRQIREERELSLAAHIMEGITALDQHRRMLAQNDPVTNALLADLELSTITNIQRNLSSHWGV